MNKYATKESRIRVIVWMVWFLAVLVSLGGGDSGVTTAPTATTAPLLGIVSHDANRSGPLFPWQATSRWKKWVLHKYRTWQAAYRRARRAAQLARLALHDL